MSWWPTFLLQSAFVLDITLQSVTVSTSRCRPRATNQRRCGRLKLRTSDNGSKRIKPFVFEEADGPHYLESARQNYLRAATKEQHEEVMRDRFGRFWLARHNNSPGVFE